MRQILASLFFLYCLSEDRYTEPVKESPCVGYTKIAYSLAIDCKGDTIKIEEHREFYQRYLKSQKP